MGKEMSGDEKEALANGLAEAAEAYVEGWESEESEEEDD